MESEGDLNDDSENKAIRGLISLAKAILILSLRWLPNPIFQRSLVKVFYQPYTLATYGLSERVLFLNSSSVISW